MEHSPVASIFLPGIARNDPRCLIPETSDKIWNDAHTEKEVFPLVLKHFFFWREQNGCKHDIKVKNYELCHWLLKLLTDLCAMEESNV